MSLIPRRSPRCRVAFEPGDLLLRLEKSLATDGDEWEARSINLRLWIERALMTISSYCPEPFFVYNNLKDTFKNYKNLEHKEIATDLRENFLNALDCPQINQIKNSPAHDAEPLTKPDVIDALKILQNDALPQYRKIVDRLKILNKHYLQNLMIEGEEDSVQLEVLQPQSQYNYSLNICGQVAAAKNKVGVKWEESISSQLDGFQQVMLVSSVISPIAHENQILLLDSEDRLPDDGDLVVAETATGERYVRRFWEDKNQISLECVNLTEPISPVILSNEVCELRRIVGIYFDGPQKDIKPNIGKEWVPFSKQLFNQIKGLRVVGTSMEPIAQDGQIILINEENVKDKVCDNDLVCVDGEDLSPVIKRCFLQGNEWILCSINPDIPEVPIVIEAAKVIHAYFVVGVLFEVKSEIEFV